MSDKKYTWQIQFEATTKEKSIVDMSKIADAVSSILKLAGYKIKDVCVAHIEYLSD